jgi:hypothetical protein
MMKRHPRLPGTQPPGGQLPGKQWAAAHWQGGRRRAIATFGCAAVIGSAAVFGGSALASASPAAQFDAGTTATLSTCGTAALRVWVGVPGSGTAGPIYYQLEMSNISRHICKLYGYPGVSAVAANGAQLGSAAAEISTDPKVRVILVPGATAHVLLGYINPGFFPRSRCRPANAVGLRVYPPNNRRSVIVNFPLRACSKKGPEFLGVRTTQPGTGIPGYSR